MNLENWINEARAHWQEFQPSRFKALKASGKLELALRDAAERTAREMDGLEASGMTNQEAWEVVREQYLFPPEEGTKPAQDSPFWSPSAPASATDLMHAATRGGARSVEMPEAPLSAADLKNAFRGK